MNRILSVDSFRLAAIIGVIAIHTSPFRLQEAVQDEVFQYIYITINQLARFAVPFFFVISGYFWGVKVRKGHPPIALAGNNAKRIFFLFVAWSLIYLLPLNFSAFFQYGTLGPLKVVYWNIIYLTENPVILIMQGTKAHLWFFVGLLFSLAISAVFVEKKWFKSLIVLSLVLFVTGVFSKAYVDSPLGIESGFDTRFGPFFGTLLFVSGYYISGYETSHNWLKYGFFIFLFGCVSHFLEIYFLFKAYGTNPIHDYVFGTYFMGVGTALMALSNHPVLRSQSLGWLGKMTLGVYAIHFIYVDMFAYIDEKINTPIWELAYIFIVLTLSIITVIVFSKNRFTNRLVS
jgi:surface polysaccharide O-acyltransferase-like enzyme